MKWFHNLSENFKYGLLLTAISVIVLTLAYLILSSMWNYGMGIIDERAERIQIKIDKVIESPEIMCYGKVIRNFKVANRKYIIYFNSMKEEKAIEVWRCDPIKYNEVKNDDYN